MIGSTNKLANKFIKTITHSSPGPVWVSLPIYGILVNSVKSSIYTRFACGNHKMPSPHLLNTHKKTRESMPDWPRPRPCILNVDGVFILLLPFKHSLCIHRTICRTWRLLLAWALLLPGSVSVFCSIFQRMCGTICPLSRISWHIYQMYNWICQFPFHDPSGSYYTNP